MSYRGRHVSLRRSRRWPWLVVPALALGMGKPNTDEFPAATTAGMALAARPPAVTAEHERPWRRPPAARIVVKPKPKVRSTPIPPAVAASYAQRMQVLRKARQMLGVPYVWGGTSLAGIDCSGFTLRAYATAGLRLPHYSFLQHFQGRRVSTPLPGDLVWWGPWTGARHVAIYYGGGQVIGARHSGTVSAISPLWGSPRFYRMF